MHLFLIGLRATGKSSVAAQLADRLQRPRIDLDEEIARHCGQSIAQLFQDRGEAGFRSVESELLKRLVQREDSVVALGGGAVLDPANRQLINATGKAVWLRAEPAELSARMRADPRQGQLRPPLTELEQDDEVAQLARARRPIYEACADYTVDTGGRSVAQVADQIAKWWSTVDK